MILTTEDLPYTTNSFPGPPSDCCLLNNHRNK